MKTLALILPLFLLFSSVAQTNEETSQLFWEAVTNNDSEEIITHGEKLIKYALDKKQEFDSDIYQIRMFTAISYESTDRFENANNLFYETYALCKEKWGAEHEYTMISLGRLAAGYSFFGDHNSSKDLFLMSLELNKNIFGDGHENYAMNLSHLADEYSSLGDHAKSKELNEQCLSICEKIFGKKHSVYTLILSRLATEYSYLNDFNKSKELNEQCLVLSEQIYGKEHPDYCIVLSNLASDYADLEEYQKAIELYDQCLNIRERILGKEHPDYLHCMAEIALIRSNIEEKSESVESIEEHPTLIVEENGRKHEYTENSSIIAETAQLFWDAVEKYHSEKTIEYGNKLIEYIEKENIEFDETVYKIQLYTALSLADIGAYESALKIGEKTFQLCEEKWGTVNYSTGLIISFLGTTHSRLDNEIKSRELFEKSLEIFKLTVGKEHPDYAMNLYKLAISYSVLRDYSKSIQFYEEALKINEKIYGKEHSFYIENLNNLAFNYSNLGNFTKAKELNEQCLRLSAKMHGKEHPDYAESLNNLAMNFYDLGDFAKSKELNEEALRIKEKAFGKEHPDYALSLNNIALVYHNLGDFNKSKELNEECLKIIEKIYGVEHPEYARSLNNLASNYHFLGDYNRSKELNERALKINRNEYGNEHPAYATNLNNLAGDYAQLGNFYKSSELYEENLKIREKTNGKEHPFYARGLSNCAFSYGALGDYETALSYFIETFNIKWNNFTSNKFGLTPGLKSSYKRDLETSFYWLASISFIEPTEISTLNNYWINLNGVIGSDESQAIKKIQNSNDSALISAFEDLKLFKLQLGKHNEMTIQERAEKEIDTEQLEKEIEHLESQLSRSSKDLAEMNREFSIKDVKASLANDEVLVDITRISYYDFSSHEWSDSVKYLVFVTDNSQDTIPQHLFINTGRVLEEEIFSTYSSFTSGSNRLSTTYDELSYAHFWKPIAEMIGDKKTVYVSLGGVYNNINLNALYNTETSKYLFEEKDIRIVNSSRDLVLNKEREKIIYTNQSAALFGYPDYNGIPISTVDSNDYLASQRDLAPFWIDSLSRGGMTASLLPETKTEVENISLTLTGKKWDVSTYLGDEASEAAVKELESPRAVHIATHGYFFKDIPLDKTESRFMGMDRQQVIQDPLLRSGLLFAGANKTLNGEDLEGENGLLSAYEAGLLNLKGTELVVLSACETGRGEVKNSEGVYGLRKAISDAGAANTIMSLWKVDDKVTQEFMSNFYSLWINGKTIREAFNETQTAIKLKYPQPYYWGAFVLVGSD